MKRLSFFALIISVIIVFDLCQCQNINSVSNSDENTVIPIRVFDISYGKVIDTLGDFIHTEGYIKRFDTTNEVCLDSVSRSIISPDGKKLLIAGLDDNNGELQYYIIDLTTMKEKKIELDYDYFLSPSWCPNSDSIAFITTDNEKGVYEIGLICLNDTQTCKIFNFNLYSAFGLTWTTDGKYIVLSDFENIYLINILNNKIDSINIFKTFGNRPSISNSTIWFTSDNKKIIFNAKNCEPKKRPVWAQSIFLFDIEKSILTFLSPPELIHCCDLYRGADDDFFFTGYSDSRLKKPAIYKVNLADSSVTKIIDNAVNYSCRYN